MGGVELRFLAIADIVPSPYQMRRHFDIGALQELARSMHQDGLIEPVVVRPQNGHFELIAGERRVRAAQLIELGDILARVVEATDRQARRMCAAENLQRQDLSAIEAIEAIIELIDAEIEDGEYLGRADTPKARVKWLLSKMHTDMANSTDYYISKFTNIVEPIFSRLPKPIEWVSFYTNDLRLVIELDKNEDVKELAITQNLNKSQARALNKLKKDAPKVFENMVVTSLDGDTAIELFDPDKNEVEHVPLVEISAREIDRIRKSADDTQTRFVMSSSKSAEWYTPPEIIKSVLDFFGEIDLDPCSNSKTHPNIPAKTLYTAEDNGLVRPWFGRVYMNPPYGDDIPPWIERLVEQYEAGAIEEALTLIPGRIDTAWYQPLYAYPMCHIRGRLTFENADNTAPFPSVVVYLGERVDQFIRIFTPIGPVLRRITED